MSCALHSSTVASKAEAAAQALCSCFRFTVMGKSQSKQLVCRNCVRFALVGSAGCGKSAFVNAVRGIDDKDEDAAPVSLVEKRQQPKTYSFPSHPHVTFCELPGYNTPSYSDGETFWKKLEVEKFDAFLIFVSFRVIQIDLEIIERVKSIKKPLFLVRTMIAVDCGLKEGKIHIKEEVMLSKIKKYLVKTTGHLSCAEENIFLIDNYNPYKWDFFRLIQTIINIMPDPQKDKTCGVTEQYMADVGTFVEKYGVSKIQEFLREQLERSKDVEIRFAITGDSETEKSAFINAIRGLECDDNEAGKICHKTTASMEYKHPKNPKISFVDLPCIGTPKYLDFQTFCDTIRLEEYDAFLILTLSSFTPQDLELAKKVKSMGKSFFLVRTTIDDACLLYEKRRPINEADVLQKIKDDCARNMNDVFYNDKEIFLISSYHKDKWDFDRLIEAINEALPAHQRECLTLSLSNVTRNCLKRKAEFLKAQAFAVAAISVDSLQIPAVGNDTDVARISNTIEVYYRQLGLNDIAPEDMKLLDKEIRGIIERYHLTSATEFALPIGTKILGVEEVFKFIPVVGTAIAGSMSFVVTLAYLTRALDELEEAALAVWDNAAKNSIKKISKTTTNVLKRPGFVKKIITTDGGVLKIHGIILKIGSGCVSKDTEITMINHDQNDAFKSLLSLGLIDAVPRVVEFLPDSLKFLKPVDITIAFEMMSILDSQPFILYGYYDCECVRTVWKRKNIAIEDKRETGVVNIKIDEFCFYSLILAKYGKLPRILSHLNHSFTCCAYVFYRRLPSVDTIDIAVVILSEFVDEREEQDIKQLKDHREQGFVEGPKGMMKHVRTDHRLEICLRFPGVESASLSFKIDELELDKDGFWINNFKRINIKCPASGMVEISEIDGSAGNQLLWSWDVREKEQEIKTQNDVNHCKAKFTNTEMSQLSRLIGKDWDELAGLMDIPYSKRDEIRVNHPKYPDSSLKAEQVLVHFNSCEHSCRHHLEKCLKELGRGDLKNTMLPVENKNVSEEDEKPSCPSEVYEKENVENKTPLSPREMCRLSLRITADWDTLAGLMDIAKEQRDNIRSNTVYYDDRARAEKILSIFNLKENFSRKKLAECFIELGKLKLVEPVTTGENRKL